ncbi:3-hydroxyacyl-CoA dehydrogenase NAD-binding domain-containing protein [Puniceibacterium sediminis]|uniref:3-hydroxyacyl-CoA dehydrogenase n=1 Tax=Puniceibacterium sediminis TaxID=1608407 RepID=A0A238X4C3_9RHOB|nr:3-hydroxyacyl-CoA dehydrogenase NAD-binding domain-containing protein [Puniceibacterium sediminis]SNR53451.1 3-hydroxyacyl-CoA dehydrogenase [Puniceibacterium sediminis]
MTRVACIGAGLVGSSWAYVFAKAGCDVTVFDQRGGDAWDQTRGLIGRTAEVLGTGADAVLERIRFAPTLAEALSGVEHVQESIKEDVAVKRAVFAEIDALSPAEAILASSTSALLGSTFLDIPGAARAMVAHPVNPPALIPLVELCPTPATAPETVERTRAFMERMGMKPVSLTREIEGFLLNRLQYTLVAEAMHLIGEGYCTARDIDRVLTDGLALRWATIGPFGVAHLNAAKGFQDFVDHLGGMMRTVGRSARTDYDWPEGLVADIHKEMDAVMPVRDAGLWQAWRDENIHAVRRVQSECDDRAPGNG